MSDGKNDEATNNENQKESKGLFPWLKAHKKQILCAGIIISPVIIGVKNSDISNNLCETVKNAVTQANLYSTKWFTTVSDEVLKEEREKVRVAFCSCGNDFAEAGRLQNLLWKFDEELSKRAWGNEIPHAPSIHREHGWYLKNDD